MDICKTGAEHIRSLQDGRTVYIDRRTGPRRDHEFRRFAIGGVRREFYDFQAAPENIEQMTFALDGANRRQPGGRYRAPIPRWSAGVAR